MKFQVKVTDFKKLSADCFTVGIFEKGELTPAAAELDKISQGFLTEALKEAKFKGKIGDTLSLYRAPHLNAPWVLLIGCGKKEELSIATYRKMIAPAIKAIRSLEAKETILFLTEIALKEQDMPWKIKQSVELCHDAAYQFDQYKSKSQPALTQTLILPVTEKQLKMAKEALKQGLAVADGVKFTKDLANQPSNVCTPSYLAQEAQKLAKTYQTITVKIFDKAAIKKLRMGAFLAVAKGSEEPPKLICLEYKGTTKKEAPVALVGKGVTFDTGGISLKPADSMIGMKYDMCGAATVLGTMKAIAELKLPINVVGVIPTTENMPSGSATKPEDIVTSLSGQTIEIMNTDAEGRLILCDALTYCERYKPSAVIDIATLTGAVVIALGYHATGLLSNHQPLANELLAAGQQSYDRAWQMPLWEDYQNQLKSPFADFSNVGGRSAGVITAACFLSRFAKKFHWAHLDVAGTAAMMGGPERYATGRPVPLLIQFLINRCHSWQS